VKVRPVVIAADAEVQLAAIRAWWIANRPAAPDLFDRELDAAVVTIGNVPHAFPIYREEGDAGIRRALLPRSRYARLLFGRARLGTHRRGLAYGARQWAAALMTAQRPLACILHVAPHLQANAPHHSAKQPQRKSQVAEARSSTSTDAPGRGSNVRDADSAPIVEGA